MDRAGLLKFWNDAWNEGLWAAAWSKSVADLTPEQAAWKPAAERHSIWQIVSHMIFWRRNELRRLDTGVAPTQEEIARLNFPEPAEVSANAWRKTVRELEETQQRIAAAMADERMSIQRVAYLLPHDCYHFGQISYLRALLGLKPIE
jgi:uncharacterized damage-inducible protein DinB